MKKVLLVAAWYSIFEAKGQLNGYLTYLTEKNLQEKWYEVKISDVTKDTLDVGREVKKLLWADTIIYITPIMWFNIPTPLVNWFSKVLLHNETFVITEEYGEGWQVPADRFMIVTTSNLKRSDLGKGEVLKNAPHIDNLMQPLIMTNSYLSIRNQIPTFHAWDVIASDTKWIESSYLEHLDSHFKPL